MPTRLSYPEYRASRLAEANELELYRPRTRKRVLLQRRMVLRQVRNAGVITNTAAIQAFFEREQGRQLYDDD